MAIKRALPRLIETSDNSQCRQAAASFRRLESQQIPPDKGDRAGQPGRRKNSAVGRKSGADFDPDEKKADGRTQGVAGNDPRDPRSGMLGD